MNTSFPPVLLPFLRSSHGHFCFAVCHKVGLRWEEVLAVTVASAAVELVWLQDGTLRPFVAVGLPPANSLSSVPALQAQPHCMASCDCVGTVRQRAAHRSRAGAKRGPCGPGDTQGSATWHCPCHVCQGSGPDSRWLATVAVGMRAVRGVGAVGNVAVATAFGLVTVWLESRCSSCSGQVAFCWEG